MRKVFSFGKNWLDFLNRITKENVRNACTSLTTFLELTNLEGKTFLDIGCGSGLFSYAAYLLKAKKILSFDIDPLSFQCCKILRSRVGNPKKWIIRKGSILDKKFVYTLDRFDIVYAWGVLHHTGNMYEGIKNSAKLVKKNGYYYISIYNKVVGPFGSNFWLKVKQLYNSSPSIVKNVLELLYILRYYWRGPTHIKSMIKTYPKKRGMELMVDVRDWLGGYPYEFATVEEILRFMKRNFSDFNLINIKTTNSLGNNWFLFQRKM